MDLVKWRQGFDLCLNNAIRARLDECGEDAS